MKNAFFFPILIPLCFAGYWIADYLRTVDRKAPADPRTSTYVSSVQCGSCHPKHYESWRKTYHRSMTAPATPENMKAPIDSTMDLQFYGYTVRFQKTGNAYTVELPARDGAYRRFPLVYTIGSRRMQQFAIRDEDRIYRIPVFYSIERQEWMHINEAFFYKKGSGLQSFLRGYAIWNPNCIFCHNTRPDPGLDPARGSFNSRVAETGIACEECHAPGETHAGIHHNPFRRYLHLYTGIEDTTVTDPKRLDGMRGVQVCGQCHGQRLPQPLDRIQDLMQRGDPYSAGENLFNYYKPLAHTDELPVYKLFHLRFWRDGTPRLTAYELQGVLDSKCFQQSVSFSCITCHSGHRGDPKGMIEPPMRTDTACTQCHKQYKAQENLRDHTKHKDGSTTCYSCHMPEVVYGVMTIHPTHLIANPNPASTVIYNKPNACSLCHLDKSVNWAVLETNRLWNKEHPMGDSSFDLPEITRGMISGDVVYRTVLLYHARTKNLAGFEAVLMKALEDPFYAVSRFAADALIAKFGESYATRSFPKVKGMEYYSTARTDEEAFEFGE